MVLLGVGKWDGMGSTMMVLRFARLFDAPSFGMGFFR